MAIERGVDVRDHRIAALREENRELKARLVGEIAINDDLRAMTLVELEAENIALKERLAHYIAENARLRRP
jgi:ribosomal protein L29